MNDTSKSSLTYGDSSTTLTQLGLVDGGTVLCTTNQTGSREERQIQKLEIAAVKRAATSRTSSYNRDNLPTKYSGNTVIDNANVGGLQEGRPWAAFGTGDYILITESGDTLITEGSDTLTTE
jgi:hypothetical protein